MRAHPDGFIALWDSGNGLPVRLLTSPLVGAIVALSCPGILAECI